MARLVMTVCEQCPNGTPTEPLYVLAFWDLHLFGTMQLPVDHFITHEFKGLEQTNEAIHALHSGSCLRAVVKY